MKSYKHNYDDFFNDRAVKQETEYLHYFVPEFRKPLKLRMKSYDSDGITFENKDFVVASSPGIIIKEQRPSEEAELNKLIEQSLLEVPLSKLKREIIDEIAEKELINRNDNIQIEENMMKTRESQLWTDKYLPKNYYELLSDDKINREVLTWLKTWDPIVFKKRVTNISIINA